MAVLLLAVAPLSLAQQAATEAKARSTAATSTASSKVRQLNIAKKPWTGDFDKMFERRMIRVYVP